MKISFLILVSFLGSITLAFSINKTIYVTPNGSGNGTKDSPSSLVNAFRIAQKGDFIKLSDGVHEISNPIYLIDSIIIDGGYNSDDWNKSSTPEKSIILRNSNNPEGVANNYRLVAIYGNENKHFRLSDLTITTDDGTLNGTSTYGLHLTKCGDYKLIRCIIKPGNASNGKDGNNGEKGLNGKNGDNGIKGDVDNYQDGAGGDGGNGGLGAQSIAEVSLGGIPNNIGSLDVHGQEGSLPFRTYGGNGAGGGAGGSSTKNGGNGGNISEILGGKGGIESGCIRTGELTCNSSESGKNGENGENGVNGNIGRNGENGWIVDGFWQPGTKGQDGTFGSGGYGGTGGGGGAGRGGFGCTDGRGYGGGGGGGGGQGGTAGTGGYGGGSSFAILLNDNYKNGYISQCQLIAGEYGEGGIGGKGGEGGEGGAPGLGAKYTGTSEVGCGGDGGRGGSGGTGGNGGNGRDGISQNIYITGLSLEKEETRFPLLNLPQIDAEYTNCSNTVVLRTTSRGNWNIGEKTFMDTSLVEISLNENGYLAFSFNDINFEDFINIQFVTSEELTLTLNDSALLATENLKEYTWLDCNNFSQPIENQTSYYFKYNTLGSFAIEINNGVCIDTSECYSTVNSGISEFEDLNNIKIFPNPIDDIIYINSGSLNITNIKIYNLNGNLVFENKRYKNSDSVTIKNIETGYYFILLTDSLGKTHSKKISIL